MYATSQARIGEERDDEEEAQDHVGPELHVSNGPKAPRSIKASKTLFGPTVH